MQTGCFGQSILTAGVTILYLNVVINIYNAILVSLNFNFLTSLISEDDIDTMQYLITIQTILSVLAIVLFSFKRRTSCTYSAKFWIFGFTFMALCLDLIMNLQNVGHVFRIRNSNSYAQRNTSNAEENESTFAFYTSPIFLSTLLLSCYFVFKFYAAIIIFRFTSSFGKEIFLVEVEMNITNSNDIERNTSPSIQPTLSISPPGYDECLVVSESQPPPPPYCAIFKY